MDLDAEWSRLFQLIHDARLLLERVGEDHWSGWLEQRASGLRSFGANGIAELALGFGGMGSFNDLLVLQVNGHHVLPLEEDDINARLDGLRRDIYRTAERIRTNAT